MILVLAHHYDVEASWLCRSIQEHCGQSALLLWPEALGVDYCISLQLHGDGGHHAEVSFFERQMEKFDGRDPSYAVNRLGYIEPLIWDKAAGPEKAYAAAEINAFFSAFVRALPCPVSNPVRNGALWAGSGFEARWASLLHRRGVAVHPLATAGANEALGALSRAHPASIRRWLHFEGHVFPYPGHERAYPEVEMAILHHDPDELLEFIAIEDSTFLQPHLLWVSRTPALSCYGHTFVRTLTNRIGGCAK